MSQSASRHSFDTVEEFDVWAETQPERWELHDGIPVAMAPERANHLRIKARVWSEFDRALQRAEVPCETFPDGLTVRGPGRRSFIPDVTVLCGDELGPEDTRGDVPVIVIEVLSPSTEGADHGIKLESYFALPSIQHYLIVASLSRRVVHHARVAGGGFHTTLSATGVLYLDPPGVSVSVDAFYARTNLAAPPAP